MAEVAINSCSWLKTHRVNFLKALASSRVPHASLFSGVKGVGKKLLVEQFADTLLCQSPVNSQGLIEPCGHCKSCTLRMAGHHPDRLTVSANDKGTITVDLVRVVIDKLSQAAHQSGNRVVLIELAEKMNVNAANALLKTLEEPMPGTYFMLTSEAPSQLLPTILSRCQHIPVAATEADITDWLSSQRIPADKSVIAMFHGAPFAVKSFLASDEFSVFEQLRDQYKKWWRGEEQALGQMKQLVSKEPVSRIDWLLHLVALHALSAKGSNVTGLNAWYDQLVTCRKLLSQSGINQMLQIEKSFQFGEQLTSGTIKQA
ncbi:DNA polymerase III subunit delta' [Corallincola platygyrae]|uniref:DNA-directed DNA polymerase n=1 Tax=Corallincola platygyrae TaxID=1193278 RepID=A0ABW4XI91_9GAMM